MPQGPRPDVALAERLRARVDARAAEGLYRQTEPLSGYDGARAFRRDGTEVLVLCGNDYLGLAADPRMADALARGAREEGAGAGAAHLVTGHRPVHEALEEDLAAWTGREGALLFSTGYMANMGVLTALFGRGDRIYEDRLNHASLIDGVRLSGARPRRYAHADIDAVQARLLRDVDAGGHAAIVTDGVFSMDGDLAPLQGLGSLAATAGATLIVDDAHGLGVIGPSGRGTLEEVGCPPEQVPVLIGTLGKGFGAFGAFVAGSEALIDALRQFARTYIYTTAPPPGSVAAARCGLRLAQDEPWRRNHVHALVARFRAGAAQLGIPLGESRTPIQPLPLGTADRAVRWSAALETRGLRVAAIRPPTVPEGEARLRISLTACHREDHVDRLLDALADVARHDAAWMNEEEVTL